MPVRPFAIVSVIGFAGLSACGGAGNPFDDAVTTPFGPIASDEVAIHEAAFQSQRSDVLALQATPASEVPDSGDATFNGRAQITVTPDDVAEGMVFTGNAAMEVAFAERQVGLRLTNFTGSDMLAQTIRLEGSLAVENGVIDNGSPNTFGGSFSGVLLGNGLDIRASNGAFEGTFRDIPTTAAEFAGRDETATYNAAPAEIALTGIVAE